MVESQKSKNCGAGILTGSAARFVQQRVYRFWMEQSESLSQSNSVKMGGTTILLVNCQSMEVSNLLDFLKFGVVDCRVLTIFGLTLIPQVGSVVPMGILFPLPLVPLLSL